MRKADRWHEQGSSDNDGSEVGEGLPVTGALSLSGGQYPQHPEQVTVQFPMTLYGLREWSGGHLASDHAHHAAVLTANERINGGDTQPAGKDTVLHGR